MARLSVGFYPTNLAYHRQFTFVIVQECLKDVYRGIILFIFVKRREDFHNLLIYIFLDCMTLKLAYKFLRHGFLQMNLYMLCNFMVEK